MDKITLKEAITFVRARLDELAEQNDMLADEMLDDRNLHLSVKHLLPDALNTMAMAAPSEVLDGEDIESQYSVLDNGDGVLTINIDPDSFPFLRLAALKIGESGLTVADTYDELSPVGRMQLNKYIRGTYDNPVVVQSHANVNILKYYSVKGDLPEDKIVNTFKAIRRATPTDFDNENTEFPYPVRIKDAALTYLVGLVLQTYKDVDWSNIFMTRANEMLKTF